MDDAEGGLPRRLVVVALGGAIVCVCVCVCVLRASSSLVYRVVHRLGVDYIAGRSRLSAFDLPAARARWTFFARRVLLCRLQCVASSKISKIIVGVSTKKLMK